MKSFFSKVLNELVFIWLVLAKFFGRIIRYFSAQERTAVLVFGSVLIVGLFALGIDHYYATTKIVPASGGELREGILGNVSYLNPILTADNSVARDITTLIYPSLMMYGTDGALHPDIVDTYTISVDHLTYSFTLKKNLRWQDGSPITADDVVYTLQLIQNPAVHSPLASLFSGVAAKVESPTSFTLTLPQAYEPFLGNLTFGILPKHIWANVDPKNIALSPNNLQPIGAGPYLFDSLQKDEQGQIQAIAVKRSSDYWGRAPYINKIAFYFYPSASALKQALLSRSIDATMYLDANDAQGLEKAGFNEYLFKMPRYFAVFFNQKSLPGVLDDQNVRQALAESIDKQAIIDSVFSGKGTAVYSPVPDQLLGYNPGAASYPFSLAHAQNILQQNGWVKGTDGILEKNTGSATVSLSFTLTTSNQQQLTDTANLLAAQWKKIGADVHVTSDTATDIENSILPNRNFQALLYGESLNIDPDPYSFWDSTQASSAGLNITDYTNSTVDQALADARQSFDQQQRAQDLVTFQSALTADIPAIFLYNPNLLYIVRQNIGGIVAGLIPDPAGRFSGISSWYINTKRVAK